MLRISGLCGIIVIYRLTTTTVSISNIIMCSHNMSPPTFPEEYMYKQNLSICVTSIECLHIVPIKGNWAPHHLVMKSPFI